MATMAEPIDWTALRYSRVAIWLHWIIAGLIIANLLLGFSHEELAKRPAAVMLSQVDRPPRARLDARPPAGGSARPPPSIRDEEMEIGRS